MKSVFLSLFLVVSMFVISANGITKKQCCENCKVKMEECMKKAYELFKLSPEVGLIEKCETADANCKADCGGGCALID